MTFKQAISLRNIMIILCTVMLVLLGQKVLRLDGKMEAVREAERLDAAGDLIAAEKQFRLAAANSSIRYKEELTASRLQELAPITTIRSRLDTLVLMIEDQLTTRNFTGFMESYASLFSLKSQYMISGGPYESYYRRLSAESGISDRLTAGFQQFKAQFLAGLAASQSGASSGSSTDADSDSFKWSLLQIPDAYYGSAKAKEELLAEKFKTHDTARLTALAAAGSFSLLLDNALSLTEAYSSHSYNAPWVGQQAEDSAKTILHKDIDAERIAAFSGHAVAYCKYAASAGLASSKVLTLIDSSTAKLLRSATRMVRGGQYAEAIRLYGDLSPLQNMAAEIAAAQVAWNAAEPVRLLPGGEEPGKYAHVVSVSGRYGTKLAVAGTDNSGRLYYADMKDDGSVSTRTGDIIPGYEALGSLAFDDSLSAYSGAPVVVAQGSREDGRTAFTAYTIRPEGISLLFSFAGSGYELQPGDGSIRVMNADTGDGVNGQTAVYRQTNGSYQFSEIYQKYPVIEAAVLELHPFEKVSMKLDLYIDSAGRTVASSGGRYIVLQGSVGQITGPVLASGQFQNSYDYAETDTGEQYVPVFVVETLGSLSLVP